MTPLMLACQSGPWWKVRQDFSGTIIEQFHVANIFLQARMNKIVFCFICWVLAFWGMARLNAFNLWSKRRQIRIWSVDLREKTVKTAWARSKMFQRSPSKVIVEASTVAAADTIMTRLRCRVPFGKAGCRCGNDSSFEVSSSWGILWRGNCQGTNSFGMPSAISSGKMAITQWI